MMRRFHSIVWAILLLVDARAAYADVISGRVLDAGNQPVAGALVVVCDQQSGIPIHEATGRPFTQFMAENGNDNEAMNFARALTDEQGRFTIDDLADGDYKLIALSWPAAEGPVTGALEKNGNLVILRGIAERVHVPAEDAEPIEIRPLGTAAVRIDQDDSNLLVISTAPLAADPILGFAAWSGDYIENMLAASRMPRSAVTVRGLPAGTIHVAAFSYDNVPGFGGATTELVAGRTVHLYVPMIAGWSNAVHDPPDRLVPLYEEYRAAGSALDEAKIREQVPEYFKLMEQRPANMSALWSRPIPFLDRPIELEDGRVIPFKDWLAVVAYADLRVSVDRRAARARKAARQEQDVDENVTYEQAFTDLYDTLGAQYPCFELKRIDWSAVGAEFLPRAKEIEDDEAFGLLCAQLVARLEDSHAHMLEGAARLPDLPLPRFDPGFACLVDDRDLPVVYYVDPDGPAASAGVRPGMTVTAIDGVPALEAIDDTMALYRKWSGYSSERYLRYHAFRWFTRRFEPGTKVRLELAAPDGTTRSVMLPATKDIRYVPRLAAPVEGVSESPHVSWTMLDDDVGYIYVRRMRDGLIPSLDAAVAELMYARGIIIDVRGNSGGGFDGNIAHLNFALDRDDEQPERPRFKGPMAVLIDARCISAGEGWASWFIANERATFFGEATAGASARKTVYTLTNGLYKVRFPVKAYKGYLGRPIERRGLEPDVPVMPNVNDIAAGRDTVLEAARAHLIREAEKSVR